MDEAEMAMSIWLVIAQRYYATAFDTVSKRVAPIGMFTFPIHRFPE